MLYSKLVTIADNIIPSFYTSEVKIYEIGQESTDFYIIREGVVQLETEITLTKVNKLPIKQVLISTKKYNYQIQECKAGNIIGIEEILEHAKRPARAISKAKNTVLYCISADIIEKVFSDADLLMFRSFFPNKFKSNELKRILDGSIKSNLKKIKTISEITQPLPSSIFTSRYNKKRSLVAEGLLSTFNNSTKSKLIFSNIEFKRKV